jgi:hypothetical protein
MASFVVTGLDHQLFLALERVILSDTTVTLQGKLKVELTVDLVNRISMGNDFSELYSIGGYSLWVSRNQFCYICSRNDIG